MLTKLFWAIITAAVLFTGPTTTIDAVRGQPALTAFVPYRPVYGYRRGYYRRGYRRAYGAYYPSYYRAYRPYGYWW
jgi:hypothetical protein